MLSIYPFLISVLALEKIVLVFVLHVLGFHNYVMAPWHLSKYIIVDLIFYFHFEIDAFEIGVMYSSKYVIVDFCATHLRVR